VQQVRRALQLLQKQHPPPEKEAGDFIQGAYQIHIGKRFGSGPLLSMLSLLRTLLSTLFKVTDQERKTVVVFLGILVQGHGAHVGKLKMVGRNTSGRVQLFFSQKGFSETKEKTLKVRGYAPDGTCLPKRLTSLPYHTPRDLSEFLSSGRSQIQTVLL
jgi:hypothetical protein